MPHGGPRPGAGRKPLKKSERLSVVVGFRISPTQEAAWRKAARKAGYDLHKQKLPDFIIATMDQLAELGLLQDPPPPSS